MSCRITRVHNQTYVSKDIPDHRLREHAIRKTWKGAGRSFLWSLSFCLHMNVKLLPSGPRQHRAMPPFLLSHQQQYVHLFSILNEGEEIRRRFQPSGYQSTEG